MTLPETELQTSRFIFGTASLFSAGTNRQRMNLLAAAADYGFSHFDTAPYYGFGQAERDLGKLMRSRPDLSVTTKVGIYSPGGEAQPVASIFMRKIVGRVIKPLSRPTIDFSIQRAQASLEGSLRRLNRSNIKLYMLHEPEIELLNTEEWQRWLENRKSNGEIDSFGLALTAERLLPFLQIALQLAKVVQVLDSHERHEADVLLKFGRPLQITYGYVSSAKTSGSTESVQEILKKALIRNPHGAVIVSTRRIERLVQYNALLEQVA